MKLIWYLKSIRVLIGLMLLLVGIFDKGEGEMIRNAWDGSMSYRKPIDTDQRIGLIGVGIIALGFGLYGRHKKLQALSNEPHEDSKE